MAILRGGLAVTSTPRVLLDARFSAKMRGGDRCRFELAQALAHNGRASYCLLGYEHITSAIAGLPSSQIIQTHIRPNQHPQAEIFEHLRLPWFSRRHGFDIYHGTFNVLPLVPAAKIQVVTLHDMAVFDFPEAYGHKFGIYMRRLIGRGIASAAAIIAVSTATSHKIIARFPKAKDKIVVIPNGVGEEFLTAGQRPAREAQSRIANLSSKPYVLFVGNLEPKKNLVRLIEAFMHFKARFALPHELLVVGEQLPRGPGSGLSVELIQKSAQHVKFLGYVPDALLPDLYRAASLVAYPSTYEGFGMPVLEGLAAGVPVLTSNVSSLPEVAGGHACLVDPLNIEAISMGLYHSLTDASWRARAVEGGLLHAKALSWSSNARATEDLYFDLVSRRSRRV